MLTPSTMLPLGTPMPVFDLPEPGGGRVKSADLAGKPVLVMFLCNHCPYVKHVAPQLRAIGDDYAGRVHVVAVSSNDAAQYPDDAPEKMIEEKRARGYRFPYVYDADQSVAKAFGAACTPDFFLFDAGGRLFYRGQLDDSRPTRIRSGVYDSSRSVPTGADLRGALDAALRGQAPPAEQRPSMGCNIKWK